MVLGGNPATTNVEIIDIETPSSICPKPSRLPSLLVGGAAVLGKNNQPIVCGNNAYLDSYLCYYYENQTWLSDFRLVTPRKFSAMTFSPFISDSSTLFIAGGNMTVNSALSSVEVRTPTGWELFQPSLPVSIFFHCMVLVDKITAMIIGGVQNGHLESKTFKISDDNRVWTSGPALSYKRYRHTCSMIIKNGTSVEKSLIVVGGLTSSALSSVEVLDKGNNYWQPGPTLPAATWGMAMTEDPKGGVLMVGGYCVLGPTNAIYRLMHAAAQWELLKNAMSSPNYYISALLIPDNQIGNCSFK